MSERDTPNTQHAVAFFREMKALRTDEPALAEPWNRAFARIIDFAIAGAVFAVVTLSVFAYLDTPMLDRTVPPTPEQTALERREYRDDSWAAVGVGSAAMLCFVAVCELVLRGRGPGKRLQNLWIVEADSFEPPPFPSAVLRLAIWGVPVFLSVTLWSAHALSGFLGLFAMFGVAAVTMLIPGQMFFDNDRRGLHDRAAGTRVVTERH